MKNLFLFLTFSILTTVSYAQNVVFSYSVINTGTTSIVSVFASAPLGTPNNLTGFASYIYYDNTKATVASFNSTPIIGAPTNWTASNETSILFQAENNPNVPIVHSGYFFYQNLDNNLVGFNVPTSPTLLMTVVFNILAPTGGNAFLAGTSQVPGLSYTDNNFNSLPVIVTGLQTQALPLELLKFEATSFNNTYIQLNWTTTNERNSKGFDIERSTDGKIFEKIGFVKSNNRSENQNYTLNDSKVMKNELYYYRLKMIDQDGRFEYSSIQSAMIKGKQIIEVYPNPSNGLFNIAIQSEDNKLLPIKVVNVVGIAVLNLTFDIEKGVNQKTLDLSILPKGIYHLLIGELAVKTVLTVE
jgi:hypothetical protein